LASKIIELNKQIQSMFCITNIQEVCDLIRSSSPEFNHVNVATALRKGLQAPRRGVSPEVQWVPAIKKPLHQETQASYTLFTW
jgi:hypothetical protein